MINHKCTKPKSSFIERLELRNIAETDSINKKEDGFILALRNSIKKLLGCLTLSTIVFYATMAIWNDNFDDFYYCSNKHVFYPKGGYGQWFHIFKSLVILWYSIICNWFFFHSRQESKLKKFKRGDITIRNPNMTRSFCIAETNTHWENMENTFGVAKKLSFNDGSDDDENPENLGQDKNISSSFLI